MSRKKPVSRQRPTFRVVLLDIFGAALAEEEFASRSWSADWIYELLCRWSGYIRGTEFDFELEPNVWIRNVAYISIQPIENGIPEVSR